MVTILTNCLTSNKIVKELRNEENVAEETLTKIVAKLKNFKETLIANFYEKFEAEEDPSLRQAVAYEQTFNLENEVNLGILLIKIATEQQNREHEQQCLPKVPPSLNGQLTQKVGKRSQRPLKSYFT